MIISFTHFLMSEHICIHPLYHSCWFTNKSFETIFVVSSSFSPIFSSTPYNLRKLNLDYVLWWMATFLMSEHLCIHPLFQSCWFTNKSSETISIVSSSFSPNFSSKPSNLRKPNVDYVLWWMVTQSFLMCYQHRMQKPLHASWLVVKAKSGEKY